MALICAVNPGGRHVQWLRTQSVSKEFVLEADRVMREPGVVPAGSLRESIALTFR